MKERKLRLHKVCIRCHQMIMPKDNYVRLTEYLQGKQNREQFFHLRCFEDMMNIKNLALGMAMKANKLMEMAGVQLQ